MPFPFLRSATMAAINNDMLGEAFIVIGERIKAGKCELSQEQSERIFSEIENAVDVPISKEQACSMLGISRSNFDAKVASGQLPRGRHRRGFKELVWMKNEIRKKTRTKERRDR